jgi:hypothetical protein
VLRGTLELAVVAVARLKRAVRRPRRHRRWPGRSPVLARRRGRRSLREHSGGDGARPTIRPVPAVELQGTQVVFAVAVVRGREADVLVVPVVVAVREFAEQRGGVGVVSPRRGGGTRARGREGRRGLLRRVLSHTGPHTTASAW